MEGECGEFVVGWVGVGGFLLVGECVVNVYVRMVYGWLVMYL